MLCLNVNTLFAVESSINDTVADANLHLLDELVVKGSQRVAKLKGDGVQVKIAGSHLANTGTALELLGKMPFVTGSGSDIEVVGKGKPLIYINGRQVRDMSELDQLASTLLISVDAS